MTFHTTCRLKVYFTRISKTMEEAVTRRDIKHCIAKLLKNNRHILDFLANMLIDHMFCASASRFVNPKVISYSSLRCIRYRRSLAKETLLSWFVDKPRAAFNCNETINLNM